MKKIENIKPLCDPNKIFISKTFKSKLSMINLLSNPIEIYKVINNNNIFLMDPN